MNGTPDDGRWSAATAQPGELFTIEGRIRQIGELARTAKHLDPRSAHYRRSMRRTGLAFVAAGLALIAVWATVTSLLG